MPLETLSEQRIAALLTRYVPASKAADRRASGLTIADFGQLYAQLGRYLDLLMRWNQRTNLTAIRDPEEIVRRHFGESLFAAGLLVGQLEDGGSVLDVGSGAGLPGIPIQLLLPKLRVTLAESQGKKAAFLREIVRALGLSTEVWSGRAEDADPTRQFDVVTLRAVDRMRAALPVAIARVSPGGLLMRFGTGTPETGEEAFRIPGMQEAHVLLHHVDGNHGCVPRGTQDG